MIPSSNKKSKMRMPGKRLFRRPYSKRLLLTVAVAMILAGCTQTFYYDGVIPQMQEAPVKANKIEEATTSVASVYDLDMVTLDKVVDGDTLWVVNDGEREKVRLIGIDTPESVHSDKSKNNEYGEMASEYVKTMLADTEYLYLSYDEEITDRYGRTLAYVWLTDDTSDIANMLNATILIDGYAINKEYKPNVKYAPEFEKLRSIAEESDIGLWAYDGYENLLYGEGNE